MTLFFWSPLPKLGIESILLLRFKHHSPSFSFFVFFCFDINFFLSLEKKTFFSEKLFSFFSLHQYWGSGDVIHVFTFELSTWARSSPTQRSAVLHHQANNDPQERELVSLFFPFPCLFFFFFFFFFFSSFL